MFRALILIASLVAAGAMAAAPASAEEVRISLAGKDAATIRAEISKAAEKVCAAAYRQDRMSLHELSECVRDSAETAMAKVPAAEQQAADTSGQAMQVAAR